MAALLLVLVLEMPRIDDEDDRGKTHLERCFERDSLAQRQGWDCCIPHERAIVGAAICTLGQATGTRFQTLLQYFWFRWHWRF